jgi:hypothetical protein
MEIDRTKRAVELAQLSRPAEPAEQPKRQSVLRHRVSPSLREV